MTASAINPYQPPQSPTSRIDGVPIDEIRFVLSNRNLRHGQSHHLIRCRPWAVSLVSVVMIGISLVAFSYAVFFVGSFAALLLMPLLMGVSAWAYQVVIRQPQRATEQRMAECGLVAGAHVKVEPHPDHLIVETSNAADIKTVRWNRSVVKRYRTPLGLMIVPEPFVFLFLPSRGQFDRLTFQSILELFPHR
ncbi:hypothetical protein [Planctomycetes bacterium K23_9]|uniref:YcxB-like protein domain-containing protein n=1 Tax=Stieleria marina TaxID=1930275 RepID=A0A517NS54_9BACT|nr:hypothetical protein K239x_19060 [Planctomycetes bacterium K23_9]